MKKKPRKLKRKEAEAVSKQLGINGVKKRFLFAGWNGEGMILYDKFEDKIYMESIRF